MVLVEGTLQNPVDSAPAEAESDGELNPLQLLNICVNAQLNFVQKMCSNYPLEAFECSPKT